MSPRLQELTDIAIKFIRNAEKLALQMDERGVYIEDKKAGKMFSQQTESEV